MVGSGEIEIRGVWREYRRTGEKALRDRLIVNRDQEPVTARPAVVVLNNLSNTTVSFSEEPTPKRDPL